MSYTHLPSQFPISMPDLATGSTYRSAGFFCNGQVVLGVVIKASQALSVRIAYGTRSDSAATAGVDTSAALPFKTAATTFASSTGTEGGTYHELAVPASARVLQLVVANSSGSTVSGATIDAGLRVVAFPGGV